MQDSEHLRFLNYITPVRNGNWHCLEWQGKLDHRGYGRFWYRGQWRQAHRIGFMWLTHSQELRSSPQKIPDHAPQLDHRCNNRACVRKSHLKPVTMKRNHELRAERYWKRKKVRN